MIINTKKMKVYLKEEKIKKIGSEEEALDYYTRKKGQTFETVEKMKEEIGECYFIYEDEWYDILMKDATDVVSDREKSFFKTINKYKLSHMNACAMYMVKNAHLYGITEEEAYILGYIHDIGYINGRKNHEEHGYKLLLNMGIKKEYAEAVRYHGTSPYDVPKEKITPYMIALWDGDSSVDAEGNIVGKEKRLADIEKRYGNNSIAYKTMKDTIQFLKEYSEKR